MWTPSSHVVQKQGTYLAGCTHIMCSSLTACTNQVLFFNYPLDEETPETYVGTIIVLYSLSQEWRQAVVMNIALKTCRATNVE